MELTLTQTLQASPASLWPYITDPTKMNEWSTARIELVAAGDGGGPGGVGTFRKVYVKAGGRTTRLKEVIVTSEPPHRLVYQVFDTEPITAHRGEITLQASPEGCVLTWHVTATYRWPGMGWMAKQLLVQELQKSLQTLAIISQNLANDDTIEPTPQPHKQTPKSGYIASDKATMDALYHEADEILAAQEQLAQRLAEANDPKRYFAQVYAFVTRLQLEACQTEQITHKDWVLRLIPRFHTYYADNLLRWQGEKEGSPEGHWADAFAVMEQQRERYRERPTAALYTGLMKGIQAHIEEDLPRALAQLYSQDYADQCDYARFRADYLRMGGIFAAASDRLLPLLPNTPWIMKVGNDGLFGAWKQSRMKRFYNVTQARAQAFERGQRLVLFSPDAQHFERHRPAATKH